MSYGHVVFDLDGTLIDSRQDLADAANALLARHAAPPLAMAEIVGMVGEGARTLVDRVLRRAGLVVPLDVALDQFLAEYDERLVVETRPYDGVVAMLDALGAAGCRLSVLTNKPQRATDLVLELLGLRAAFFEVVGGDTPRGRKPDTTGLRALIDNAQIPPGATLMVGDSWVDAHTAAAAGIDACLCTYGFGYAGIDAATRASARWHVTTPGEIVTLVDGHRPVPSRPPATPV